MNTFSFGRSKSTTLRYWTAQSQQTCVGAYKGSLQSGGDLVGGRWFCLSRLPIRYQSQIADRSEPTIHKPTMLPTPQVLPFYQPGNLETYKPTTMETWRSGYLQPTSLENQSFTAWWPTRGRRIYWDTSPQTNLLFVGPRGEQKQLV